MASARLTYFDQMKGTAIALVVIGHIMQFSFGFEYSRLTESTYLDLSMFFYISGYFAYRQIPSFRDMGGRLLKRCMILLFPYIVFLSMWCIFNNESNIIQQIIDGGSRYWFLFTLCVISTFFIIYEYILSKIQNTWFYVILWILPYIALIAIKLYLSKNGGGSLCGIITGLVNYYRYFLIGYLCKKYIKFNDLLFNNDIISAIGLIAYFLNWYFFELHNLLLIFTGTLGGIIVIQRFFQKYVKADSKIGAGLSNIGKMSLAIYVIHYFFIPDVSSVMHNFLDVGNPFIWQLVFAVALSIPIIAASMFVGKLIEMNKYLNFIFFGKTFSKDF